MEVKKYQIQKMQNVNSANRIVNDIRKIETIFNAKIDKATKTLYVECTPNKDNLDEYYKWLEGKINKAIKNQEKHARVVSIDNKEVFRKVLYLNGLDCAYCAARVENIAKKELNHQRIVVDYPTYRFIIETTDKELVEQLVYRVTEIAHKVDERIVVTSADKEKPKYTEIDYSIRDFRNILAAIGIVIFIIGCILAYDWDEIIYNTGRTNNTAGVVLVVIGYILIGNKIIERFFKNALKGRILDENFLMTIASIGALVTQHFVEAAVVMLLYQLGEFLQNLAVNRSRKSIAELLSYEVQNVKIKLGNEISEIAVEGVLPDDVILVGNGEMIPIDGKICKGKTFLDTKNITGESRVREVEVGDEVLSGSLNVGSLVEVRVIRTYNNSMMSRILDMVENATINKAKSENFITKFCRFYTPIVVAIAFVILSVGILSTYFVGEYEWTHCVYVAMEFLVISCPCALVISIPLCFFSAIGVASKQGILIRGSNYLEALYDVENIVFDKTGTLTKGKFELTKIVPAEGYKEKDVERLVMHAEYYSMHPIGKSIVDTYGREKVFTEIIDNFQSLRGGAKALVNGSEIMVANSKLAEKEKCSFPLVDDPNLILYIFKDHKYIGYIVIGDTIREEAYGTLQYLKKKANVKKIFMMTGDSSSIAMNVANRLLIDEVHHELLPDQKVNIMDKIKAESKNKKASTIYIGDGVNDAPVIASADVGIAMGDTASDATISIADVVIMTNDLEKLKTLAIISKKTRSKVLFNILFCLIIKFVVMILALGFEGFDFELPLWFAIFSDVGVSLLTILNSLSIMRLFGRQQKIDLGKKEEQTNE